MLTQHLPILVILFPLLTAPLAFALARFDRLVWLSALLASLASFLCAIALVIWVQDGSVISYHLGGYPPPFGIELRIDALSALVILFITASAVAIMVFAFASIPATLPASRHVFFYIAFLLTLSGLLGVVATADAFNMFVFLEISSISTYILIALGSAQDKRALSAAYNYLILGTIGATFFVLGVGFLYAATGSLNMGDIASKIPILNHNRAVQAGFALILTGLALKIALFPLHFWLPNAYSFAPNSVAVFLSATATKAALYALIRFLLSVFGAQFTFGQILFEVLLLPLAIIGMILGSIIAIFQKDLRFMLSWSSIAQISFIIFMISLENQKGLEAAMLHLFNHAFIKATLFMAIGMVAFHYGQKAYHLGALAGLARRQAWVAALILISGAGLVGVPLTSGFISKWVMMEAAFAKPDSAPILVFFIAYRLLINRDLYRQNDSTDLFYRAR